MKELSPKISTSNRTNYYTDNKEQTPFFRPTSKYSSTTGTAQKKETPFFKPTKRYSIPAIQNRSNTSINPEKNIIQRKKIPTNFGEFETTKFEVTNGKGVKIILKFHPDEKNVDAKKIALIQSVRSATNGIPHAIDPNRATTMVRSGKHGAGYAVDRVSNKTNPIYGAKNLKAGESLKDTALSNNTTKKTTNVGSNTTYELGHCYKKNVTDTKKDKHSAGLYDNPRGKKKKGKSKIFETTALAIDGVDKDKYYGSVKWGYKMEGTEASPTVTKIDISEASKGMPTSNFTEPVKLWNISKSRGTLKVIANPATVLKGDSSGTEKLAKGKKLKQIKTVTWRGNTAIKGEVLKADGTGSGKIYYVKNSDLVDIGNGDPKEKLPLKNISIVKSETVLKDSTPQKNIKLPYGTQVEVIDRSHLSPHGKNTDPYFEMIKIRVIKGNVKGTEGWVNHRLVR